MSNQPLSLEIVRGIIKQDAEQKAEIIRLRKQMEIAAIAMVYAAMHLRTQREIDAINNAIDQIKALDEVKDSE